MIYDADKMFLDIVTKQFFTCHKNFFLATRNFFSLKEKIIRVSRKKNILRKLNMFCHYTL